MAGAVPATGSLVSAVDAAAEVGVADFESGKASTDLPSGVVFTVGETSFPLVTGFGAGESAVGGVLAAPVEAVVFGVDGSAAGVGSVDVLGSGLTKTGGSALVTAGVGAGVGVGSAAIAGGSDFTSGAGSALAGADFGDGVSSSMIN